MREILVIARQFPPHERLGAVVRAIKFCKYLPLYGFKPVIVTVHKDPSRPIDPRRIGLLDEISGSSEIHYVPESRLIRLMEKVFTTRNRLKLVKKRSPKYALLYCLYVVLKAIAYNLYRPFRKRYVIPDEGIFWNRQVETYCAELIRKRDIRYLFTTSPANSTHLIGQTLKARFNLTWCADFRDGWIGNPLFQTRFARRNKKEERLCKGVLRAADIVVSVNDPLVDLLRQNTDDPADKKFVTIYNGYDPDELAAPAVCFDKGFVNIIHCGVLTNERNMGPLLTALTEMVGEGKPFRLYLLGDTTENHCLHFGKQYPDVVRIMGIVSRSRTMAMLKGADVALLIQADIHYAGLSGKIFEYLGCDKRVIGLVPDGIAREFIERYRMGWCCSLQDKDEIRRLLDKVYCLWKNGQIGIRYPEEEKSRFDRRVMTEKLADLLKARGGCG